MNGKTILSGIVILVLNLQCISQASITKAVQDNDAAISGVTKQFKDDYPIRHEINRTFQISSNGVIDVSGIEGAVEVETITGNTTNFSFVREARTQTDFDCETIDILQTPDKLAIKHKTKNTKGCKIIQAREHLKLVVPRSATLYVNNIEGDFTAGAIEGFLRLGNIEGGVQIERARAAEISSIEGGVILNITEINSPGININNIEGNVELGVKDNVNAVLNIDCEDIQINVPSNQSKISGRKTYRLQIGSGGENISISNIEGGVKISGI